MDFLHDIAARLDALDWRQIAWGLPIILGLVGGHALLPGLRKRWERWRLRRAVRCLGPVVAHDVALPDGVEGLVFVDHLVLAPDGVLVIDVQRMEGSIFCGKNMDMWAQITGNRSYKFANPLVELEKKVLVVRSLADALPVKGLLLFDRHSDFPKGKPAAVVRLNELRAMGCSAKSAPLTASMQRAWTQLMEAAAAATAEHAADYRPLLVDQGLRRRARRGWLALLAAGAAAGWLLWGG